MLTGSTLGVAVELLVLACEVLLAATAIIRVVAVDDTRAVRGRAARRLDQVLAERATVCWVKPESLQHLETHCILLYCFGLNRSLYNIWKHTAVRNIVLG